MQRHPIADIFEVVEKSLLLTQSGHGARLINFTNDKGERHTTVNKTNQNEGIGGLIDVEWSYHVGVISKFI